MRSLGKKDGGREGKNDNEREGEDAREDERVVAI